MNHAKTDSGIPSQTRSQSVVDRGDLAHLALFLWATATSGLLVWTMKELARSNKRFSEFVNAIAKLNQLFGSTT